MPFLTQPTSFSWVGHLSWMRFEPQSFHPKSRLLHTEPFSRDQQVTLNVTQSVHSYPLSLREQSSIFFAWRFDVIKVLMLCRPVTTDEDNSWTCTDGVCWVLLANKWEPRRSIMYSILWRGGIRVQSLVVHFGWQALEWISIYGWWLFSVKCCL